MQLKTVTPSKQHAGVGRILLVSSIVPSATNGGPLLLYRHLVERTDFDVFTIGPDEMQSVNDWSLVEKIMNRLRSTRFHKCVRHYEQIWKHRRLDSLLRQRIDAFNPQVVLTVAHGPLFWLARQVSKQRELPLVSIFHDWWPYLVQRHCGVSKTTAAQVETRFRALHKQSDCVMPICDGMADELGPHCNTITIAPIPPTVRLPVVTASSEQRNKIVYMGDMSSGYGSMLQRLLYAGGDLVNEIRCFGNSDDWPYEFRKEFQRAGILSAGPVQESQLTPYLSSALALIVTLPIDHEPDVWRRTSFPSKLVSYLQYERPIIYWSGPDSSLIKWARAHKAKAIFTDPDAKSLLEFFGRLKAEPRLHKELCEESKLLAAQFEPSTIHEQFRKAIINLI